MASESSKAAATLDFVSELKLVLTQQLTQRDDFVLDRTDIEELLRDEDSIQEKETEDDSIIMTGYPHRPLFREIGKRLNIWMLTNKCPLESLPVYDLLDEHDYMLKRKEWIKEISPKLQRIKTLHADWSKDELFHSVKEILVLLGKRGILDILGLRKTVGTADVWPPPRRILEDTFSERHSPESSSLLTVGARALAKHFHRDQSSSWWGVSTGTEVAKNEQAFQKMTEILNNATWINIHEIVHGVLLIEVREEHGYGARWTGDGKQFRGFLEPQMINGHETGWKH